MHVSIKLKLSSTIPKATWYIIAILTLKSFHIVLTAMELKIELTNSLAK